MGTPPPQPAVTRAADARASKGPRHARVVMSVKARRLPTGLGAQRLPDGPVDAVPDEPDGAVGEGRVHPAAVLAAGRRPGVAVGLVLGAVEAVRIVRGQPGLTPEQH